MQHLSTVHLEYCVSVVMTTSVFQLDNFQLSITTIALDEIASWSFIYCKWLLYKDRLRKNVNINLSLHTSLGYTQMADNDLH